MKWQKSDFSLSATIKRIRKRRRLVNSSYKKRIHSKTLQDYPSTTASTFETVFLSMSEISYQPRCILYKSIGGWSIRAGPGMRPLWGQYRNITPNFWCLNLQFWHVISSKLSNTFEIGCEKVKCPRTASPKFLLKLEAGKGVFLFYFFFSSYFHFSLA